MSVLPSGLSRKRPVSMTQSLEVLLPTTFRRFVRVSAPRPAPQFSPNVVVHRRVRHLCDDVPMVIGPSPDLEVELINQDFLLRRAVHPDGFSDAVQKRLHVFGRRHDEKLAAIFAYILPEKVEDLRDMRDFGLLVRKLKTPLGE